MYATWRTTEPCERTRALPSGVAGRPPTVPTAGGSFTYAAKRMDPTTFTLGL